MVLATKSSIPEARLASGSARLCPALADDYVGSTPPFAAQHHAARRNALAAIEVLARDIDIVEVAFIDAHQRRVAERADFERAEIVPLDRARRRFRRGADDVIEVHAEAEEFRHGGDEVVR